jgi:hypothetical protein
VSSCSLRLMTCHRSRSDQLERVKRPPRESIQLGHHAALRPAGTHPTQRLDHSRSLLGSHAAGDGVEDDAVQRVAISRGRVAKSNGLSF